jgi:putative redox protein
MSVRVTGEKVKGPLRLDSFKIEIDVAGELSDDQLKGVEEAVHRCLIHQTLLHPPKVDVEIKAAVTV